MVCPIVLVTKSRWSLKTTPVMPKALSSMAQTGQEWSELLSLEYRPEVSRLSYSCYTADTPCMQIIRSYVKNACPKSQCTAHPWLRKIAPVALPNRCSVSLSRIAPKT